MIVRDNRTGVELLRGSITELIPWKRGIAFDLNTGYNIFLAKEDMNKLLAQEVLEKLKGEE